MLLIGTGKISGKCCYWFARRRLNWRKESLGVDERRLGPFPVSGDKNMENQQRLEGRPFAVSGYVSATANVVKPTRTSSLLIAIGSVSL